MKCFKCGAEMEPGYIQSNREIFWSTIKHKQEIRISSKLFMDASMDAFRCPLCGIVLIDKQND